MGARAGLVHHVSSGYCSSPCRDGWLSLSMFGLLDLLLGGIDLVLTKGDELLLQKFR